MTGIDELEVALQHRGDSTLGAPDLTRIRRDGRRLRTRRRALGGAGVALAVAATTGAVLAGGPLDLLGSDTPSQTGTRTGPYAGAAAPTDADLLDACRSAGSPAARDLLFGPGDPVVKAVGRTTHRVTVALQAADSAAWGECSVAQDAQELPAALTVYPADGETPDLAYSFGPGCGLQDGSVDDRCRTWAVTWVDRRPAEVAAARLTLGDGGRVTVDSHDGYLVLEHLAPLPQGETIDGMGPSFPPLRRITFLDAQGRPIAAEAQDGSGKGPDHERVGDLPRLSRYPSLRGAEVS